GGGEELRGQESKSPAADGGGGRSQQARHHSEGVQETGRKSPRTKDRRVQQGQDPQRGRTLRRRKTRQRRERKGSAKTERFARESSRQTVRDRWSESKESL